MKPKDIVIQGAGGLNQKRMNFIARQRSQVLFLVLREDLIENNEIHPLNAGNIYGGLTKNLMSTGNVNLTLSFEMLELAEELSIIQIPECCLFMYGFISSLGWGYFNKLEVEKKTKLIFLSMALIAKRDYILNITPKPTKLPIKLLQLDKHFINAEVVNKKICCYWQLNEDDYLCQFQSQT